MLSVLLSAISLGALLLSISDSFSTPTFNFIEIVLNATPTVNSIHDGVRSVRECAGLCAAIVRHAGCSGLQVSHQKCSLFSNAIEERVNTNTDSPTESETAYRLTSVGLPKCAANVGFREVYTPTKTYCFAPSSHVTYFQNATSDCISRHATVAFLDSREKIEAAMVSFGKPYEYIWNGVKYDAMNAGWIGQRDGDVLFNNNTIWMTGEPSNFNEYQCVVILRENRLNDIPCNGNKAHYVCEIKAIF